MTQIQIPQESKAMKFFRWLGLDSIAWALRRLYCPVDKKDLVLEVGSGGSPYFRSNVLCDAYEETQERFYAPLVHDRPTVIAFIEQLPFKNDCFDFVIASHVLEHSSDPERFLSEIQRVGKAGYIEVPDAFMERLTHYTFHKLEISEKDGELIIRKKKNYIQDKEIVDLFHNKARSIFPNWASKFPFHFHVRYYWKKNAGGIKYSIINPDLNPNWDVPNLAVEDYKARPSFIAILKRKALEIVRRLFSQHRRNAGINLEELLQCTSCKKGNIKLHDTNAVCNSCNVTYKVFLPTHD